MPRLKSEPLAELSAVKKGLLFDLELPYPGAKYAFVMDAEPGVHPEKALWEEHRDAALADWVKERPGTRPSLWWRYDAPRWNAPKEYRDWCYVPMLPEPRLRLGGVGVTMREKFPAYSPHWPLGVPDQWSEIDAEDPPSFESQAAYLRRHKLFLDGEEARLTDADFEPVTVPE